MKAKILFDSTELDNDEASEVFSIAYVSRATEPLSEDETDELERVSIKNNTEKGITGILIMDSGTYLQVLEGSETSVLALLAVIKADLRHTQLKIFAEGRNKERRLDKWAMVLRTISYDPPTFADSYHTLIKSFFNTPIRLNLSDERIELFQRLTGLQNRKSG